MPGCRLRTAPPASRPLVQITEYVFSSVGVSTRIVQFENCLRRGGQVLVFPQVAEPSDYSALRQECNNTNRDEISLNLSLEYLRLRVLHRRFRSLAVTLFVLKRRELEELHGSSALKRISDCGSTAARARAGGRRSSTSAAPTSGMHCCC